MMGQGRKAETHTATISFVLMKINSLAKCFVAFGDGEQCVMLCYTPPIVAKLVVSCDNNKRVGS